MTKEWRYVAHWNDDHRVGYLAFRASVASDRKIGVSMTLTDSYQSAWLSLAELAALADAVNKALAAAEADAAEAELAKGVGNDHA